MHVALRSGLSLHTTYSSAYHAQQSFTDYSTLSDRDPALPVRGAVACGCGCARPVAQVRGRAPRWRGVAVERSRISRVAPGTAVCTVSARLRPKRKRNASPPHPTGGATGRYFHNRLAQLSSLSLHNRRCSTLLLPLSLAVLVLIAREQTTPKLRLVLLVLNGLCLLLSSSRQMVRQVNHTVSVLLPVRQ